MSLFSMPLFLRLYLPACLSLSLCPYSFLSFFVCLRGIYVYRPNQKYVIIIFGGRLSAAGKHCSSSLTLIERSERSLINASRDSGFVCARRGAKPLIVC